MKDPREYALYNAMLGLGASLWEMDWNQLLPRQRHVFLIYMLYGMDRNHLDFFLNSPDQIPELLEALDTIGGNKTAQFLRDLCKLFPGGFPSPNPEECRQQINDITAGNPVAFGDMIPETGLDSDLFQRLYDYWRREAPLVVVNLSTVQTAADLLQAVSQALGLPGSYGNSLDKFGHDLVAAIDLPRLTLRGWDRVSKRIPRDAELLLECFKELGKENPTAAVFLDLK